MLRLKRAAAVAAVLAGAACTADSMSPTAPTGPQKTISDAAHSGQVPGFYFLPPMVPQPSYSGTFDANLTPSVQICELSGTTCGTAIATFTFGTGASNVKVDVSGQTYQVNWKTSDYNLDVNKNYRISVYQGSFLLGFADVDVVGAAKDLRNVDTGQYIALLDDRTLPIKFRIETGIPAQVVVTPASDSVNVGDTKQFTASCLDLHGNAVSCPATTWSSSNTAVATVDNTGLATGVSPGTVTITASIGYASGTATLKVIQPDTPPTANPDTFQAIGNVTIPVPAPGVLGNDTDAETPSGISAVPGTVTSANGGTVVIAADGSFTYLSASGFTGTDSFDYVVTDGTLADTATVTMNVPTRVWFVDNSATAPGDGRDSSPFTELYSADSASTGETVFVRYGNGTSSGYGNGFSFDNGQSLIGQGVTSNVTAVVNGQTIVLLAAGSAPTITETLAGSATLRLAQNNTVQGLNVNSTAGAGIAGSGFGTFTASIVNVAASGGASLDLSAGTAAASFATLSSAGSSATGLNLVSVGGTLSATGGVINNAATVGVAVSGGAGTISFGGSISGSGTRAVSITGRTGGSVTLSGDINDANGGISVQNNSGGSVAFTGASKSLSTGASNGVTLANNTGATISFGGGGLDITTTTGDGFSASGGGTVNVTGAGNTIVAAGGTALSVVNTSIGASGLSFRSISANGGSNGIVLQNTGTTNGLQVTGNGSDGSGGTIQNTTGADGASAGNGVYLSSARNVSVSWMHLNDHANNGVFATGVRGLSLDRVRFTGNNGSSSSSALEESAVHLVDVGGEVSVTRSLLNGGAFNGLLVRNTAGTAPTIDSLVIALDSVTSMQGSLSDIRNTAVKVVIGDGTADVRVRDNRVTYWWANAIHVLVSGTGSGTARITGNTASQTSGALAGAGGIWVSGGNLAYNISGNSVQGANGTAISADKGAPGANLNGTIDGNTIGTSGITNSGSATGIAIFASHTGTNATTVKISNNVIRQIAGSANGAITVQAGDDIGGGGSGTMNATVVGNNIQESGSPTSSAQHGILVTHGRATGDTDQGCYDIGGAGALANTITNFNTASGPTAQNRIRVNQRFLTTSRWPGYTGAATGATSTTDMAAYLLGRNNASNSLNANSSTGGFLNTSPAGSPCPQPTI